MKFFQKAVRYAKKAGKFVSKLIDDIFGSKKQAADTLGSSFAQYGGSLVIGAMLKPFVDGLPKKHQRVAAYVGLYTILRVVSGVISKEWSELVEEVSAIPKDFSDARKAEQQKGV